jgi:hypothetical protein
MCFCTLHSSVKDFFSQDAMNIFYLQRSGVEFPKRSPDASPIFTPPVTAPASLPYQAGYGMPVDSPSRLDEAMSSNGTSLR